MVNGLALTLGKAGAIFTKYISPLSGKTFSVIKKYVTGAK